VAKSRPKFRSSGCEIEIPSDGLYEGLTVHDLAFDEIRLLSKLIVKVPLVVASTFLTPKFHSYSFRENVSCRTELKLVMVGTEAGPVEGEFSELAESGGLSVSEAAGGHLLAKHVGLLNNGLTDVQLAARLASQPRILAVSTFASRAEAEAGVASVLKMRSSEIANWLGSGAKKPLTLNAPFSGGRVLLRGATSTVPGTGIRVILRSGGPNSYYILTGFPTP